MARREYYHETEAPPANAITPTAFVAVRDDQGGLHLLLGRPQRSRAIGATTMLG